MRTFRLVAAATLLVAVPVLGGPTAAKPSHGKAELATTSVTGSVTGSGTGVRVKVSAQVTNKGKKRAKASQTTFRLSADATASSNDPVLGTVATGKVRPKKAREVTGTFAVPASAGGEVHIIACADSALKVRERVDTNNCTASADTVTVPVSVSATAGPGGKVAASAVSGGSCTGTTCTLAAGGGSVTFTPTPDAGYRFGAWTGASCTGYKAGAAGAITFTKPTTTKACTAGFVKLVTVTWRSELTNAGGAPYGLVTGTATNGSCTASSCTVDSGAGTVVLTASGSLPLVVTFDGWAPVPPAACTGVPSGTGGTVLTLTNVASDQVCAAQYHLL